MKKFAFLAAIVAALAFWRKDSYKSDAEKVSTAAKGAKDKVVARMPNREAADEDEAEPSDSDDAADSAEDTADDSADSEEEEEEEEEEEDESADADATS